MVTSQLIDRLALGPPLLRVVSMQKGGITWPSELSLARTVVGAAKLTLSYKDKF